MKPLWIAKFILPVLVLFSCLTSSAGPTISSGGDINPSIPITPEIVANQVYKAYSASAMFVIFGLAERLALLEKLKGSDPSVPTRLEYIALMKMFTNFAKTFPGMPFPHVDALSNMRIEKSKPCFYEGSTEEKAASVTGTPEKFQICFSAMKVAKKVTAENINRKIVALIFHELSHLFGTSDPEAIAIQNLVEAIFSPEQIREVDISQYQPLYDRCEMNVQRRGQRSQSKTVTLEIPWSGSSQAIEIPTLSNYHFTLSVDRLDSGRTVLPKANLLEQSTNGVELTSFSLTNRSVVITKTLTDGTLIYIGCQPQ